MWNPCWIVSHDTTELNSLYQSICTDYKGEEQWGTGTVALWINTYSHCAIIPASTFVLNCRKFPHQSLLFFGYFVGGVPVCVIVSCWGAFPQCMQKTARQASSFDWMQLKVVKGTAEVVFIWKINDLLAIQDGNLPGSSSSPYPTSLLPALVLGQGSRQSDTQRSQSFALCKPEVSPASFASPLKVTVP